MSKIVCRLLELNPEVENLTDILTYMVANRCLYIYPSLISDCSPNPSSYALEHMPTYGDLSERQDNEIAQEIQEELVRQAEQQRQQEEKDAV